MQGMHLNEIFENNLQIFTPEDSVGEKLKKKTRLERLSVSKDAIGMTKRI